MVQSTNVVVQELETLFKSKKRLETIRSHGSHQGLIQMIDNELQGLGIDDTKKSLRQLMKKLSSFFDSLKKLMEPVMRISDNIVTYAKDTNFNQDILKQIMVLSIN
jgi:hypothetical protein